MVVPRELLEEFIGHMSEQYGGVPLVGPSIRYAMRNITDNWEAEHGPEGTTIRKKPQPPNLLSGFVFNPRDPARPPAPPAPEVAAASKAWDEAKRSGDPDAMTCTANALIRAVTKARAESGQGPLPAQAESGRHPTSEILAPQARQGHAAATPQGAVAAQSVGEGAVAVANAVVNSAGRGLGNTAPGAAAEGVSAGADGVAGDVPTAQGHQTYAPSPGGHPSDTEGRTATKGAFSEDHLQRTAAIVSSASREEQAEMLRVFRDRYGESELARLEQYLGSQTAFAEQLSLGDSVGK